MDFIFLETAGAYVEVDAVSGISCDFDHGFCSWTNDTSAEFTWTKNKGRTPSDDTGPAWDHTTQSKFRLFVLKKKLRTWR